MPQSGKHPSVFISYTHDDAEHRVWVESLARDLNYNGIRVALDQWDLTGGADLFHFMETGIADSEFVLAACTPPYKAKADNRTGGGGFETRIAAALLADNLLAKKFIPLLRRGNATEAIPTYLRAAYYYDFSKGADYEVTLRQLLEGLYRLEKRPVDGWQKGGEAHDIFGSTAPPSGSESQRVSRRFGAARPDIIAAETIDEIRTINGVSKMEPLQNDRPLARLKSSVVGFSTPWALDSDPRGIVGGTGLETLSLSRSPGGTVQLEIHKVASSEVYIVGYSSREAIVELRRQDRDELIEVMLLTAPYEEYSVPVAIPYSRLDNIDSRSVDQGPDLLDLVVD